MRLTPGLAAALLLVACSEPARPVARPLPPTTPPSSGFSRGAPSTGYLERRVDGSCWYSAAVPFRCPPGMMCEPNLPLTPIACPMVSLYSPLLAARPPVPAPYGGRGGYLEAIHA